MEANTIDREFGWDDVIENDGADFILLPEGDYNFTVTSFERARHNGSGKIPPCNKAVLYIRIDAPEGTVTIKENLMLHSKMEWKLCEFFTAIGHRAKGEKLRMNWNAVAGAKGRCRVYINEWSGDDGNIHKNNKISRFYEPEQTPPQQPSQQKWTQGSF
jgi:hypothetical protein